MNEKPIVLKWATAVSIIGFLAAAMTAHFNGVAAAKDYADYKVKEAQSAVYRRLDRMEDKLDRVLGISK